MREPTATEWKDSPETKTGKCVECGEIKSIRPMMLVVCAGFDDTEAEADICKPCLDALPEY